MPRLPPSLIRKARAANPLLVPLLKVCRDLGSASNELRWLKEHVRETIAAREPAAYGSSSRHAEFQLTRKLCVARGQGKPLQYLLGTEYFGNLELACRAGVLIPRPETADIVTELAQQLKRAIKLGSISDNLQILDLCTGTGCMALLLQAELSHVLSDRGLSASILGVDVSRHAVQTALINKRHLGSFQGSEIDFLRADILMPFAGSFTFEDQLKNHSGSRQWDVVVANPPYISPAVFGTTQVETSVRRFEPYSALVPLPLNQAIDIHAELDRTADLFYPRILDIAARIGAKILLMEVGGTDQAERVAKEAKRRMVWERVEVWKDGISSGTNDHGRHGRAVVCTRAEGSVWMQENKR